MDAILSALQGVDDLSTCLLIGSLVFAVAIETASGETSQKILIRKKTFFVVLLGFALLTALARFVLVAATMADSWTPSDLWAVAASTSFGHWWLYRIAALGALLICTFMGCLGFSWWIALFIPIFISLSGHAGAELKGLALGIGLDFIHVLTVSVWTGGLLSLLLFLRPRLKSAFIDKSRTPNFLVVKRFSHFAMASTAAIFLTGLGLASHFGVNFSKPWKDTYGAIALVKLALFLAALGVAAVNQFVHLRTWKIGKDTLFARRIARELYLEIAIVLAVFVVAGFLARLATPL